MSSSTRTRGWLGLKATALAAAAAVALSISVPATAAAADEPLTAPVWVQGPTSYPAGVGGDALPEGAHLSAPWGNSLTSVVSVPVKVIPEVPTKFRTLYLINGEVVWAVGQWPSSNGSAWLSWYDGTTYAGQERTIVWEATNAAGTTRSDVVPDLVIAAEDVNQPRAGDPNPNHNIKLSVTNGGSAPASGPITVTVDVQGLPVGATVTDVEVQGAFGSGTWTQSTSGNTITLTRTGGLAVGDEAAATLRLKLDAMWWNNGDGVFDVKVAPAAREADTENNSVPVRFRWGVGSAV